MSATDDRIEAAGLPVARTPLDQVPDTPVELADSASILMHETLMAVRSILLMRGVPTAGAFRQAERVAGVALALVAGETQVEIAQQVGVTERTVRSDVVLLREAMSDREAA